MGSNPIRIKMTVKKNKINKILYKNFSNLRTNPLKVSKHLELYLSHSFLYTQKMFFGSDSKKRDSKKSSLIQKIYIYILYEHFILKTNYTSRFFSLLYIVGIIFVNREYIIQANFIECVMFAAGTSFIKNVITLSVLFPYLVFVPGDGSKIEQILTNSELPHAKLLLKLQQDK